MCICTFVICVSLPLLRLFVVLSYVFQGFYCVYRYFCHMCFLVSIVCICTVIWDSWSLLSVSVVMSYVFQGF